MTVPENFRKDIFKDKYLGILILNLTQSNTDEILGDGKIYHFYFPRLKNDH